MTTRREALGILGSVSAASLATNRGVLPSLFSTGIPQGGTPPPLAPGAPMSPERLALINRFKTESDGLDLKFEKREHASDWTMPYRLFRPESNAKLPLVIFLHGSGGQGDDNIKQMGLGNIFGTRLWALPANQKKFPCYVLVPQTDRGWARYGEPAPGDSVARPVAGLGDGSRLTREIVAKLVHEFAIDERRIYVTGQSMGGLGVWNMLTQYPRLFAAAVPCCGSAGVDDPAAAAGTPLWNFHGAADQTVPVTISRNRIEAARKAGGHPFQTEYAGIGHNSWEWAYTEPELPRWVFSQRRGA